MDEKEFKVFLEDTMKTATDILVTEQDKKRKTDLEGFKNEIKEQLAELGKPAAGAKIPGAEDQKDADSKSWKCLSEFAHAVFRAGDENRGGVVDKRLVVDAEVKATDLQVGDSEYGGYLVPTEYRRELLKIAVEKSEIMNRCVKVPMALNAIQFPYLSGFDHSGGVIHGGVEFEWLDEAATKSQKDVKFGKIELRLKKMAAFVKATDELLEDSWVSMEPLLRNAFTDGLAYQLDNVFLNGDGAGKPMGILNAPCLVSVAIESGQAANTILFENIVKMYARLWRKGQGIWFANHDVFKQLAIMAYPVGTGGVPVYLPAGAASGKPYNTLMGLPIEWTEHCQTLGTKGDIYLCDWSQYLVGQKTGRGAGLKFDSTMHLYFLTDKMAFRFVYRVDGQPWWPTYLTPRYSSDTLSPFISLDVRGG